MANETENKNLTRTGIMLALIPAVNAALAGVPGLDLTDTTLLRRTFRALVTIGVRMLLDAKVAPQLIAAYAIEAIGHEMQERKQATEVQVSEAKETGGIAILQTGPKADLPN